MNRNAVAMSSMGSCVDKTRKIFFTITAGIVNTPVQCLSTYHLLNKTTHTRIKFDQPIKLLALSGSSILKGFNNSLVQGPAVKTTLFVL